MNAADEIRAAIDTLEGMAVAAAYSEVNGWLTEANAFDDWGHYEQVPLTNDPLLVTLHRTIDAQLAILRRQENRGSIASFNLVQVPYSDHGFWNAFALARAINGTRA